MTNREKNVALAKRLAAVRTNGEAWAFWREALDLAKATGESLGGFVDSASIDLNRRLTDSILNATRYMEPLSGQDSDPVSAPSWKQARAAIGGLFAMVWAIEEVHPEAVRSTPWQMWATLVVELPGATVEYAGDLAQETIRQATDAAKDTIWTFIKGAWPLLLAAGVVLAGGVYLAATGRAKVLPKVKVST